MSLTTVSLIYAHCLSGGFEDEDEVAVEDEEGWEWSGGAWDDEGGEEEGG